MRPSTIRTASSNGVYQLVIEVKPFNASTVLRPAKNGFTKMLELDLAVVGGVHHGRRFSELLTLEFDKQSYEENGPIDQRTAKPKIIERRKDIGRKRLRSIFESANEVNPEGQK